ncbi:hypothetical protein AEGHOMDF_5686 [Methylobacterium soli]|nr:hypothetical protein AEGHOMDF_5686 [Methylobacterium soli]
MQAEQDPRPIRHLVLGQGLPVPIRIEAVDEDAFEARQRPDLQGGDAGRRAQRLDGAQARNRELGVDLARAAEILRLVRSKFHLDDDPPRMGMRHRVIGPAVAPRQAQDPPDAAAVIQGVAGQARADQVGEALGQDLVDGAPQEGRAVIHEHVEHVGAVGQDREAPRIGRQHHGIRLDRARDVDRLALAERRVDGLRPRPLADRLHHGLAGPALRDLAERPDGQPVAGAALHHVDARAQRLVGHLAEHEFELRVEMAMPDPGQEMPMEARHVGARSDLAEVMAPDHGRRGHPRQDRGRAVIGADGPGRVEADHRGIELIDLVGGERIEIHGATLCLGG